LIFEMRLFSTNYPFNCDSGAEFYGTAGRMMVSKRGKVEVFGERDSGSTTPNPKSRRSLVAGGHQADFLDAIRQDRKPSADVAIGHDSVALVHLANAAVRLGRSLNLDPRTEQIVGDEQANALLSRQYRQGGHWAVPRGV
jgi:predicted dehydrogenase